MTSIVLCTKCFCESTAVEVLTHCIIQPCAACGSVGRTRFAYRSDPRPSAASEAAAATEGTCGAPPLRTEKGPRFVIRYMVEAIKPGKEYVHCAGTWTEARQWISEQHAEPRLLAIRKIELVQIAGTWRRLNTKAVPAKAFASLKNGGVDAYHYQNDY